LAIIIAVGWLSYYLVKKLAPPQKIEILLQSPKWPEGRRYHGQESESENRVSYFKSLGGIRGKKERIDFTRTAGPIVEYRGASRVLVFRVLQGGGETVSWGISEVSSQHGEFTHQEINKFNSLNDGLGREALASGKQTLINIIMGIPIGIVVWMLLIKLFPILA